LSLPLLGEIPVYLTENESGFDKPLTGHIDILQVRNNRLQVLDYKPEAESGKKAPQQLTLYALALGKRTQIPLKGITCAYFDQNAYFQFTPIL